MGFVTYNGKEYYEPEIETQMAFAECEMHTFRYYPKERLMIASDFFVNAFDTPKFYPDMPESLADSFILPEDRSLLYELYNSVHSGKRKSTAILRTVRGERVSRVTAVTIKYDDDGYPEITVGIVENFSEELRTNQLAEALSKDYQSIYYVDLEQDKVFPYRLSEVIQKEYGEYMHSNPPYAQAFSAYIKNTVIPEEREEMLRESSVENLTEKLKHKDVYMHDYRAMHDGQVGYYRMKAVGISSSKGKLLQMVLGFADVSYEKRKELERYAYVDAVTGGDNYTKFKEKLETVDTEGSLISMDIHSFKIVNSVCGIKKGDEVLKRIWDRILLWLEEGDCAGHISADHFVMYTTITDQDEIAARLMELKESIESISIELSVPQLIPYFGISMWSPEKKIESAVTEANEAKHQVKERKDINFFFYNIKDTTRILEEKRMEDAFEEAIKTRRFEVWYQPKYSPVEKKLVGAEALVRWRADDGSLIPPAKFIPLFERNGMIRLLDEYVFRTVCEQQRAWRDEGIKLIPISINLSRASLYFQNVVENYKKIIDEVDIYPQWVPIEITESATIDNKDIRQLADLFFEAGFPLHMDDFGTGYSSLASLNVMHFDTLKLDKSLIDYIGNYGGDRLLVHTIALAKELGMTVVAEGVENLTQVGFLKELKCDSIQGFVYSKPLPLEEFTKELKSTELINGINHRRNFDISQRNACYLNELIMGVVYEYNELFAAHNKKIVADLPATDEAAYVDIENFKYMLEILLGYCVRQSRQHTKVIFTVTQDESTKAEYCSYEMVIKASEIENPNITASSIMAENPIVNAKNIVDRHGGSIIVNTDNGVLTIVIRIGIKMGSKKGITEITKVKEKVILLAEDNELNRELSLEVLENAGFKVETAVNGYDAVEIAAKSMKNHFDFDGYSHAGKRRIYCSKGNSCNRQKGPDEDSDCCVIIKCDGC